MLGSGLGLKLIIGEFGYCVNIIMVREIIQMGSQGQKLIYNYRKDNDNSIITRGNTWKAFRAMFLTIGKKSDSFPLLNIKFYKNLDLNKFNQIKEQIIFIE